MSTSPISPSTLPQLQEELRHDKGKVAAAVKVALQSPYKSPLSQKGMAARRVSVLEGRPRSLFRPPQKGASLESIYGPQFSTPPNKEWESFRRAILDIEVCIEKCDTAGGDEVSALRSTIVKLLAGSASYESKCAELALIHFYFERDSEVPQSSPPFVERRIREMVDEIMNLKEQAHEGIPSARQPYMLRALARILLTAEGKVRVGGAMAATMILKSTPGTKLSDEQRSQILRCLKHLIDSISFQESVGRPIALHGEMEEIVRLELKLKPTLVCTQYHIKLALFIALFSDLRQEPNDPNCYAIAAAVALTNTYPQAMYEALVAFLSSGKINLQSPKAQDLPLAPLFHERMHAVSSELPLDATLTADPLALPLVSACLSYFGVHEPPKMTTSAQTVLSVLRQLSGNTSHVPKRLMSSFWTSPLLQLMVAAIQASNCNAIVNNYSEPRKIRLLDEFKHALRNALYQLIAHSAQRDKLDGFLTQLFVEWHTSLYVLEVSPAKVIKKDASISVHYHDGQESIRDLMQVNPSTLTQGFKAERRLFILEKGKFVCIRELSAFCSHVQTQLARYASVLEKTLTTRSFLCLQTVFSTAILKNTFAKVLRAANADSWKGLTDAHYLRWDELVLASGGGERKCIFSFVSPDRVDNVLRDFQSSNSFEFLTKLLEDFVSMRDLPGPYLLTIANHAFLATPSTALPFLGPLKDPQEVESHLRKLLIGSIEEIRERALTSDDMQWIFDHFNRGVFEKTQQVYSLDAKKLPPQILVKQFFNTSFAQIRPEHQQLYKNARERFIFGVEFKKLPLKVILETVLSKEISEENAIKIGERLDQMLWKSKWDAKFLPQEIAQELVSVVGEHNFNLHSAHEYEYAICTSLKLPPTIILCDLNWYIHQGTPAEHPTHITLAAKPDICTGSVQLVQRGGAKEREAFFQFDPHKPSKTSILHIRIN